MLGKDPRSGEPAEKNERLGNETSGTHTVIKKTKPWVITETMEEPTEIEESTTRVNHVRLADGHKRRKDNRKAEPNTISTCILPRRTILCPPVLPYPTGHTSDVTIRSNHPIRGLKSHTSTHL